MVSNFKEITVSCADCKIDIIDLLDKGKNDIKPLRVRCPKCKNLSFYIYASEEIGYSGCNGIRVLEIKENEQRIIETCYD